MGGGQILCLNPVPHYLAHLPFEDSYRSIRKPEKENKQERHKIE
jgi:hypothetical protein